MSLDEKILKIKELIALWEDEAMTDDELCYELNEFLGVEIF